MINYSSAPLFKTLLKGRGDTYLVQEGYCAHSSLNVSVSGSDDSAGALEAGGLNKNMQAKFFKLWAFRGL